MFAKIYSPAKNAMQSGRAKTGRWMLVFERQTPKRIEPLMGYTSSSDMHSQIRLEFTSRQSAIDYAKRKGLEYRVEEDKPPRRRRAMTYSENFSYYRKAPWTH